MVRLVAGLAIGCLGCSAEVVSALQTVALLAVTPLAVLCLAIISNKVVTLPFQKHLPLMNFVH
jgi:hypothetical protein